MKIRYRVHFPGGDWQQWMESGQIAGTLGESRPIDLLQVDAEGVGVAVQVHTEGSGWLDPVGGMEIAGIEGHQIEAVRIGLTGDNAASCEVSYRSHVQDFGWLNWTRDGQSSGTEGRSLRLEALQVYLAAKGELFFDVNRTEAEIGPDPKPEPVTEAPITSGEPAENRRRRVVDTAASYVGYAADGDGWSIFGERHGDPYGDWCHYFVWSVFEDAGLGELIPHTGYCPTGVDWFLGDDDAYFYRASTGYVPQAGDVIYFDWDYNGIPNHVGLVEGCDGETVCTIEGNTGDPNGVHRKYWDFGSSMILGYGVPAY